MPKPSTEVRKDSDGRPIADDGPSYYLAHPLENGDEWCQLESNSRGHICSAAERRSLREFKPKDGLVVRADTHEAVFYYKAKEGYQDGWVESDPEKAARRKEAYDNNESTVRHSEQGATEEK